MQGPAGGYNRSRELEIFLESELEYLHNNDWFLDGTFYICKNLKEYSYAQIYIISLIFTTDGRTYTYPVIFCFLKSKDADTYKFLFNFISEKYLCLTQTDLTPRSCRVDCEKAVIIALRAIFSDLLKIRNCTVHIVRNWWDNLT